MLKSKISKKVKELLEGSEMKNYWIEKIFIDIKEKW